MPKVGMEPIRRNQVINATLKCISISGFEGLTLDSIAKKAGISKGVVSYYFKSKEDLILQSFQLFLEFYNQKGAEAFGKETSALELLEGLIDIVVFPQIDSPIPEQPDDDSGQDVSTQPMTNLTEDQIASVLIHFYSRMKQNEKLGEVYQEMYQQYLDGVIAILKYGIETQEFKVVNLLPTAYSIMTQMDGIVLYEALGFRPLGRSEIKKAFKAHIRQLVT